MTTLCIVHAVSLYALLVGRLVAGVSEAEAARAGASAAARFRLACASVGVGFDRVVVVVEPPDGCFRRGIDPRSERPGAAREWPAAAWEPLVKLLAELPDDAKLAPPPWPDGTSPAGRDVIATIAAWWRAAPPTRLVQRRPAKGVSFEPVACGRLRIVSGRGSVVALEDAAAGIEVVRELRGDMSYAVAHPAEILADRGYPAALVADVEALALVGRWHHEAAIVAARAAASRTPRALLGRDGAVKLALLKHSGGALVAAALGGDRPEGVNAAQWTVLRWAAADDAAMWRKALLVARLRTDAPVDVAALLAPRGESDGVPEQATRGDERTGAALPTSEQGAEAREAGAPAPAPGDPVHGLPDAQEGRDGDGSRPRTGVAPTPRCSTCGLPPPGGDGCPACAPGNRPGAPLTTTAPAATPSPTTTAPPEETRPMPPTDQTDTRDTSYLEGDVAPSAAPIVRHEPAPLARPAPLVSALAPATPQRGPAPMTSDATDALFSALAMAQLGFKPFTKARTAKISSARGNYEYRYSNLSDVMDAIGPALSQNGLVAMQIPRMDKIIVRLVHGPSGQWVEGGLPFVAPREGGPAGVQAMGSMITYMRRYLLCMMVGVVAVDDDNDGAGAAA